MNPECAKMIALLLALLFVLDAVTGPLVEAFIERGRQVAVSHGCHSPRCIQWRWWFE